MKNKKYIWGIGFWFIYWILFASFLTNFANSLSKAIIFSLIFVFFQAVMAYTNILILIPRFLKEKKIILYFILVVLSIAILTVARQKLYIFTSEIGVQRLGDEKRRIIGFVLNMVIVYLISTAFHFIKEWFRSNRESIELKNRQLETELKYLKAQINPHFLFNSLNNIYTLCYLKDDKAAPSIMKLSEIMRYMLHESNVERIELNKEINFLENYIELQKLKKDNPATLNISFTCSGVKEKHKIAPLLLIVFFENSFKHSDIQNSPDGFISAEINVNKENLMVFKIKNSKRNAQIKKNDNGKVGLENAKKRLELQYKEAYKLNIENQQNIFSIELIIPLDT